MNPRLFIAIYDEQKLISEFFHNSLERLHRYDVLFRADTEDELIKYLASTVALLLMHVPTASERLIVLIKKILKRNSEIKILIYTQDVDALQEYMNPHIHRVKVMSVFEGARVFFEEVKQFLPDHPNHREINTAQEIPDSSGFEKIRINRKWILILKCYLDGLRPKEMEELIKLKPDTINAYTEQMLRETQCGNIVQLVHEAEKRNII